MAPNLEYPQTLTIMLSQICRASNFIRKFLKHNEWRVQRVNAFSGADLAALVHEAGVLALRQRLEQNNKSVIAITFDHFKLASKRITPSVSTTDRHRYDTLREKYCQK
jgi:SpoVK/Ycf46/Vps4 family AAA+-type ATPase